MTVANGQNTTVWVRICAWTRPWVWSQLPALPVSGHEHRLGAELLYVVPCRRLARDPPTHQLLRQIRLRHPEDNSDPSEPLTLPHQTPDSNHNPTSKPPPAASVAQRNRCPLSIFYGNPQLAAASREGARVAATVPDTSRAIEAARSVLGDELGGRARITVRRPPVVGAPARVTVAVMHTLLPALGGFRVPLESTATMRVEA